MSFLVFPPTGTASCYVFWTAPPALWLALPFSLCWASWRKNRACPFQKWQSQVCATGPEVTHKSLGGFFRSWYTWLLNMFIKLSVLLHRTSPTASATFAVPSLFAYSVSLEVFGAVVQNNYFILCQPEVPASTPPQLKLHFLPFWTPWLFSPNPVSLSESAVSELYGSDTITATTFLGGEILVGWVFKQHVKLLCVVHADGCETSYSLSCLVGRSWPSIHCISKGCNNDASVSALVLPLFPYADLPGTGQSGTVNNTLQPLPYSKVSNTSVRVFHICEGYNSCADGKCLRAIIHACYFKMVIPYLQLASTSHHLAGMLSIIPQQWTVAPVLSILHPNNQGLVISHACLCPSHRVSWLGLEIILPASGTFMTQFMSITRKPGSSLYVDGPLLTLHPLDSSYDMLPLYSQLALQ